MKLRELGYLLGFRPRAKKYGYKINKIPTQRFGLVEYAQWLHPLESEKSIDDAELDELASFLSPGDVVIDVGAHSGDTALPIALTVGPEGFVFALEPNPYVFPVLEKNAALNAERTRIVPLICAATEDDGQFVFEYSDPGFCNGGRHDNISRWRHAHAFKLPVQGRNLVRLLSKDYPQCQRNVRYIKIDSEGADLSILKTLAPLIESCRPYLRAEVFKHMPDSDRVELLALLRGWRYSVHRLASESNYRGELVTDEAAVKWKHFDVFCVPEEMSVS